MLQGNLLQGRRCEGVWSVTPFICRSMQPRVQHANPSKVLARRGGLILCIAFSTNRVPPGRSLLVLDVQMRNLTINRWLLQQCAACFGRCSNVVSAHEHLIKCTATPPLPLQT